MKKSCLFLNLDKKIIILNTCEGNRGIRFIFLEENLSLWMSCTIVFYNELVLWADTILNDMGEAEDLVQDFFVRLWEKKLNENLKGERVRSYLYVSVRNMAIRKVKDQSRMRRIPDISVVERVWEDEEELRDDMIDQVLKALDVLPPRSREVLECVHLKNMKYAEVAELLGISVATVKTLLVCSLKTLRGIVSDTAFLLYVLVCKKKNQSSR